MVNMVDIFLSLFTNDYHKCFTLTLQDWQDLAAAICDDVSENGSPIFFDMLLDNANLFRWMFTIYLQVGSNYLFSTRSLMQTCVCCECVRMWVGRWVSCNLCICACVYFCT